MCLSQLMVDQRQRRHYSAVERHNAVPFGMLQMLKMLRMFLGSGRHQTDQVVDTHCARLFTVCQEVGGHLTFTLDLEIVTNIKNVSKHEEKRKSKRYLSWSELKRLFKFTKKKKKFSHCPIHLKEHPSPLTN